MNDTDGERSYIEDQAETPAPQFAFRALKSALLGTPHIKQSPPSNNNGQYVVDGHTASMHQANKPSRASGLGPPLSPTKGILVTPGTGANKRKTVSFGSLMPAGGNSTSSFFLEEPLTSKATVTDLRNSMIQEGARPLEKEAKMAKSLFEAHLKDSQQRISRSSALQTLEKQGATSLGQTKDTRPIVPTCLLPNGPDTTVDLNMPCSASGKHWKEEYEHYHRKSNRELKRIIKHGQTIKSYAHRKDSEAMSLSQKLNCELGKVAAMEARVSELATELAEARAHGSTDQGESADLLTELAKQTTLAILYKQKADRYKASLDRREQTSVKVTGPTLRQLDDCVRISLEDNPTTTTSNSDELEKLRAAARSAGEKASRLQHENTVLKQKMARVKDEMKNYETRRLGKEEKLKKRETRLKMTKESCEAKLANLNVMHQNLLRTHGEGKCIPRSNDALELTSTVASAISRVQGMRNSKRNAATLDLGDSHSMASTAESIRKNSAPLASLGETSNGDEKSSEMHSTASTGRPRSPPFRDSKTKPDCGTLQSLHTSIPIIEDSGVGIEAHGNQESLVNNTLFVTESPQDSGFCLLQRETHDALQEIDQNAVPSRLCPKPDTPKLVLRRELEPAPNVPEPPDHKPRRTVELSSAVRRMRSRRSTIASPRPSLLSFAPSPLMPTEQRRESKPSNIWDEKPCRVLTMDTRTSTMSSRGGRLPPDRAEAARKRLAAKKGEKRSQVECNSTS